MSFASLLSLIPGPFIFLKAQKYVHIYFKLHPYWQKELNIITVCFF